MKYIILVLFIIVISVSGYMAVTLNALKKVNYRIDDRLSLPLVFKEDGASIDAALDGNNFFVYAKSLEYSFTSVGDEKVVEWEGPEGVLTGKVILGLSFEEEGRPCKRFEQEIKLGEETYKGKGISCLVDGFWTIKDR